MARKRPYLIGERRRQEAGEGRCQRQGRRQAREVSGRCQGKCPHFLNSRVFSRLRAGLNRGSNRVNRVCPPVSTLAFSLLSRQSAATADQPLAFAVLGRGIFFYIPALGRNAQPTGSRIAVSDRRPRPALAGGKNRISMHCPSTEAIRCNMFSEWPS